MCNSVHVFLLRAILSVLAVSVYLVSQTGVAAGTPAVPAFPGAEGFGRIAQGGRGGDVYHVTHLEDSGPGSLREGIRTVDGPRTIVFDLSGTIELKSPLLIEKPFITIAGQSAPGDGITLKDYTFGAKKTNDLIVRYIRVRLGDENKTPPAGLDGMSFTDCENIILDHVSASWGIDGIQDIRRCKNYTLQWCIFSEALNSSIHGKGPHAMCTSFREPLTHITVHHNLFSTCRDRHPTIGGGKVHDPDWTIDFRNNVIYNWNGAANVCDNRVNLINNYFRPGPETDTKHLPIAMKASLPDKARGYMSGNFFDGREDLTQNNYAAIDFERWLRRPDTGYKYAGTIDDWKIETPIDLGAENLPGTQTAEEAYRLVLSKAGDTRERDAVDRRVIQDVENRTGKLIDSQKQVGGWPELVSLPAPADTDRDGMPDDWEKSRGLDPANPEDRNGDSEGNGYTSLEEYLNGLCAPSE